MEFTYAQKLSLALVVKISSTLSIFGSSWIIQEVVRDPKKRENIYHRLLLAISLSDAIDSIWKFVGSSAIPVGTEGVVLNFGNNATCNIQGFFIQLCILTPCYNFSLSMYYFMSIKYGWKEHKLKKIEPYFHAFPLLWGFGTAIAGAAMGQYGNANLWCWLQPKKLKMYFAYMPASIMIVVATILMIMIYCHVRSLEKAVEKYDFQRIINKKNDMFDAQARHEMQRRRTKHSRKVAIQSMYYLLVLYLAFGFAAATRLVQVITGKTYYPVILLFAIFTPMQGFFTLLVYMRPRYMKQRKNGTSHTSKLQYKHAKNNSTAKTDTASATGLWSKSKADCFTGNNSTVVRAKSNEEEEKCESECLDKQNWMPPTATGTDMASATGLRSETKADCFTDNNSILSPSSTAVRAESNKEEERSESECLDKQNWMSPTATENSKISNHNTIKDGSVFINRVLLFDTPSDDEMVDMYFM